MDVHYEVKTNLDYLIKKSEKSGRIIKCIEVTAEEFNELRLAADNVEIIRTKPNIVNECEVEDDSGGDLPDIVIEASYRSVILHVVHGG